MNSLTNICLYLVYFVQYLVLDLVLLFLIIFQNLLSVVLNRKYGKAFKGFLSGAEMTFYIGGKEGKGDINLSFFLTIEDYDPKNTFKTIRAKFISKLTETMFGKSKFQKMFYKRKTILDFYYWLDDQSSTVEQYVRPMMFDGQDEFITVEDFRMKLSETVNTNLPENDTRCWELLIGTKAIKNGNTIKVPVRVFVFAFLMLF